MEIWLRQRDSVLSQSKPRVCFSKNHSVSPKRTFSSLNNRVFTSNLHRFNQNYLFQGRLLSFPRSFKCLLTSLLNPTNLRKSAYEIYAFGGLTLKRSLRFPKIVWPPLRGKTARSLAHMPCACGFFLLERVISNY